MKIGPWQAYGLTAVLVGLATGTGALARGRLDLPDLVTLYLLVVVIAAARFGRGPALLAATLSTLAYDFFFIPPTFTFEVSEQRHVLTFAMMLLVGFVTSGLTLRIRRQEHERARLAKEAEAAAARADTEEMRSALLSTVSHDLRTPLAAITGAATTLRDEGGVIDDRQRAELIDAICEEADRLERLVRNLLDMTRLESGAPAVAREWIPVEELVGSALARLEPRLAGRPVHARLPDDLPLVPVDPLLLEQALVNLLENAAKYTPAGSPIEISAHAQEGDGDGDGDGGAGPGPGARARVRSVVIDIADRGPGIPPGAEARIFEKFARGKHAGVSGAGLGLAICRGVVDAHGGVLEASNREGGGALFRMTLPLIGRPPDAPPPEAPSP